MTASAHIDGSGRRTTVLVADDDGAVCQMVTIALSLEGDFDVVGVAKDGASVIELAAGLSASPDVLLLDVSMPRTDCATVGQHFREQHPHTRIVVHSGYTDEDLSERIAGLVPDDVLAKGSDIAVMATRLRSCAAKTALSVAAVLPLAIDPI